MEKQALKLSFLLSIMFLLMIPISSNAETYDALTYSVNSSNTITITDCDMSTTEVTIPSEIDGKSVTAIGDNAFSWCDSLTSITIPDCITSIGSNAFECCFSLPSISIPDSVERIGEYAFLSCTSLESAEIPKALTHISEGLFEGCYNLKSVTIPQSITSIERNAFAFCSSLKNIIIPNGVTSINTQTFVNCSSLEAITLPDSITNIGESAFAFCQSLQSIVIPKNVTDIEWYAFCDCRELKYITIPDSVERIGEYAFYNTAYYNNSSNWENNVLYINNHLIDASPDFNGEPVYISGKYSIKENTKTISGGAFEYCTELTDITIPDSVISIGNFAFSQCEMLTEIKIPNNTTSIGHAAFYGCKNLKNIVMSDNLRSIGINAFTNCTALTEIEYSGSKAQWLKISIEPGNECLTNASVKYNKIAGIIAELTDNTFIVTPTDIPENSRIIFICYQNNLPVYIDTFTHQGSTTIPFTTTAEYDEVKVMVWDSLNSMTPLCDAVEVVTAEPISLLMIE